MFFPYRAFSHDVTVTMLMFQTNPGELSSVLTISFVFINLHICWPRERKRSIGMPSLPPKKINNNNNNGNRTEWSTIQGEIVRVISGQRARSTPEFYDTTSYYQLIV